MLALGILLVLGGAASVITGLVRNVLSRVSTDPSALDARLAVMSGEASQASLDVGTVWIVIGVAVIIAGIILIAAGKMRKKK